MAKTTSTVNDAAWTMTQAARETSHAVTESAVAAQKRNIAFAQGVLENSIELLKSHAEATRDLTHEPTGKTGAAAFDTIVESAVAAQERNMQFAQSVVESATEVLKTNVEAGNALAQTLIEQSQKQQEVWQTLAQESLNASLNFFTAPLSYYQQATETARSITLRGMETAQRITRQSADAAQKAVHQGQKMAEAATK